MGFGPRSKIDGNKLLMSPCFFDLSGRLFRLLAAQELGAREREGDGEYFGDDGWIFPMDLAQILSSI